MPEVPELNEDEKNARMLAGACYVPFFLINVVAILYVLLGRKGGSYARFHALQSLFLAITWFVVMTAVQIPVMFLFMKTWATMFTANTGNPATMQVFTNLWVQMWLIMLPLMVLGLGFLVLELVFAFWAYGGKRFMIPILGAQAEKMSG
jgi:uncharacterized membrane protein